MQQKIINSMLSQAVKVMKNAYAPYSKFRVGCSILAENGEIYVGCNVENASYSLTLCAESSAIAALVAAGQKKIKAVLVVAEGAKLITPCGACRQRIREFASLGTPIYLANMHKVKKQVVLKDLLPLSFGPQHISE